MIACRKVSKRFGQLIAVDDVSFEIDSGIAVLLGPNGAGKSTLLKMLSGLLVPDSGEIQVAGFGAQSALNIKQKIGVVPEDLGLFDSLTIQEHLELCGPIYGLSLIETRLRADPLLRLLGLAAARSTFLDRCSHGMRKKTALAMALLHNPQVLLLDEPFEGIDPVSSKAIRELLVTLSARGITVLLTSHILSIVTDLTCNIMMIRGGRIVWTSGGSQLGRPLEDLYFELVEAPPSEDLPWLRSTPF